MCRVSVWYTCRGKVRLCEEVEADDLGAAEGRREAGEVRGGETSSCGERGLWQGQTQEDSDGRIQTAGVPGAGDTGPAGDHRGEYRLQVYQELEIQDLLETTGVSTGCRSSRSWRYRTFWRPQGWVQATGVPGAGDTGPSGDHRGEYRLRILRSWRYRTSGDQAGEVRGYWRPRQAVENWRITTRYQTQEKIHRGEYRLQVYQELEIQDLLETTGVSTDCRCTRGWRYRTCCRPQGWVQTAGVPGAGDTGPAGDHRGEYRLQVYQELEIQDLLETTGVSTGCRCTRSWRYRTYWRPQGWVQATDVPGAGDTGLTGDHRDEYRLQVYQEVHPYHTYDLRKLSIFLKQIYVFTLL